MSDCMGGIELSDEHLNENNKMVDDLIRENRQLRAQLSLFEQFFNLHKQSMVITDKNFKIKKINQSGVEFYQNLGGSHEPKKVDNFFSPMSEKSIDLFKEQLEKKGIGNQEFSSVPTALGSKQIDCFGVTNQDEVLLVLNDMTKERKLERSNLNNLHMEILDKMKESLVIHTENGTIVNVNDAFCRLVQKDKACILGTPLSEHIPKDDKESLYVNLKKAKKGVHNIGKLSLNQLTEEARILYTIKYNLYTGLYFTIFCDIYEQNKLYNQATACNDMLSSLFEQARQALLLIDENHVIVKANHHACSIFDQSVNDLLYLPLNELLDQSVEEYDDLIHSMRNGGSLNRNLSFKMPNEQMKLLDFTWHKLKDNPYTLLVINNITEHKEMEEELRLSEHKFKKIFDGSIDGIIIWDSNEKIIDINEAAAAIIGAPKELIRNNVTLENIFDLSDLQLKQLKRHISLTKKADFHHFVCEVTCRDGKKRQIDISSRPKVFGGMNMTVFRDITDQRRMEEQLKKSDTLNVVGELAAGIAHEIRNPMTALKGFIQLLEGSLNGEYTTYFHVITSELQRIETIITDFLILAKPQAASYQVKQINHIIHNTLELLGAQASMLNIQFDTQYGQLPLIRCEANQLKQVFINLIKNAIEAMPTGGIIQINTETFFDNHVLVSIQDHGVGIPESVLEKIGEPFYTTKEKGTGLGLMVTYKIIEEHQGWIEVSSREGEGTLFQIYLPIYHES